MCNSDAVVALNTPIRATRKPPQSCGLAVGLERLKAGWLAGGGLVVVVVVAGAGSGGRSLAGGVGYMGLVGGLGGLKPGRLAGGSGSSWLRVFMGAARVGGGNGAGGRAGMGIHLKTVPERGEMGVVGGMWCRREGCEGAEVVGSAHPRAGAREKNGRGYPSLRVKRDPRGEPAGGGGAGLGGWLGVSSVRFGCAA